MKINKQNIQVRAFKDKDLLILWYKSDKRHREDGPSAVWNCDIKFFYLNNNEYSEYDYWEKIRED